MQVSEGLAIPSLPPCGECGRSAGLVRTRVWEWAAEGEEDDDEDSDGSSGGDSSSEDEEDRAALLQSAAATTAATKRARGGVCCTAPQLRDGALRELRAEGHTLRLLEPIDARSGAAPEAVRRAVQASGDGDDAVPLLPRRRCRVAAVVSTLPSRRRRCTVAAPSLIPPRVMAAPSLTPPRASSFRRAERGAARAHARRRAG